MISDRVTHFSPSVIQQDLKQARVLCYECVKRTAAAAACFIVSLVRLCFLLKSILCLNKSIPIPALLHSPQMHTFLDCNYVLLQATKWNGSPLISQQSSKNDRETGRHLARRPRCHIARKRPAQTREKSGLFVYICRHFKAGQSWRRTINKLRLVWPWCIAVVEGQVQAITSTKGKHRRSAFKWPPFAAQRTPTAR